MVRTPAAQAGGPGFNPQWLAIKFLAFGANLYYTRWEVYHTSWDVRQVGTVGQNLHYTTSRKSLCKVWHVIELHTFCLMILAENIA